MSRPVVYRTLSAGRLAIQLAEETVRLEVEHLRSIGDRTCVDHEASRADREQAAAALEVCADDLRSRWLPHEQEVTGEDLLFAEAAGAFVFGDASLDDVLPEAGVRVCGDGVGVYIRFADSTSSDEPELILLEGLFAQ